MKKLIVMSVVALSAILVNAATYQWQIKSGYVYDGKGESSAKVNGTAYLFNNSYSQTTLLAAYLAGSTLENLAKANAVNYTGSAFVGGSVVDGQAALSGDFTYTGVAVEGTWTGYFAMVVDDKLYISTEKSDIAASALATGTAIKFGTQSTASKVSYTGSTYQGAGWYSVPEPTSGLMLLLGVGLMALKRKHT